MHDKHFEFYICRDALVRAHGSKIILGSYKTACIGVYEEQNLKYFGYLQFKSEFKGTYLALTSLNLALIFNIIIAVDPTHLIWSVIF